MGATINAELVIGTRISRDLLYENRCAGCSHKMPGTAKFCPECGTPATKTTRVAVSGYNGSAYRGLDVVSFGLDGDDVIVGKIVGRVSTWSDTYVSQVDGDIRMFGASVKAALSDSPFALVSEPRLWLCLSVA